MLASLSLDLDNKWSYLKSFGDRSWESYPTYLPYLVPRVLELLKKTDLTITFFVVGQDASIDENRMALKQIASAGHEVGNHSFHHDQWLHQYSPKQIHQELELAEQAILNATGQKTIGFRGPGFSYSTDVLQVLSERGYQYDASTFPTFLGPMARAYYFLHCKLQPADKERRKQMFGTFRNGFQSLRPYRWKETQTQLVELPVTTMPWLKVPIHLSYVMYLAAFSTQIALMYFKNAMRFCWLNRVEPSLLLHPLDFIGVDDEPGMGFFPGMTLRSDVKMKIADQLLQWMSQRFDCVTMSDHASKYRL